MASIIQESASRKSKDSDHIRQRESALICLGIELHIAAAKNDIDKIQTLLKFGANINSRHANGNTPLQTAEQAGSENAVKLLVEKGARKAT